MMELNLKLKLEMDAIDTQFEVIRRARREYAEDGTLSSDTYMALNNAGFNADIVLAQLAGEIEDGEVN